MGPNYGLDNSVMSNVATYIMYKLKLDEDYSLIRESDICYIANMCSPWSDLHMVNYQGVYFLKPTS